MCCNIVRYDFCFFYYREKEVLLWVKKFMNLYGINFQIVWFFELFEIKFLLIKREFLDNVLDEYIFFFIFFYLQIFFIIKWFDFS